MPMAATSVCVCVIYSYASIRERKCRRHVVPLKIFLVAKLRMVRKALVDKFLCGSFREEVVGRFRLRYRVPTVDTVDEEQKGKSVGS